MNETYGVYCIMDFLHTSADDGFDLSLYTSPIKLMDRELIGRDFELMQVRAGLARPEYSNICLLAEAGAGKSQPNDTPIPVADDRGYVPIGELKVGDYVFDENGNPTKVLGVFPQGMKRCYEVGFKDGTTSKCNDEHLWNARRRSAHHEGKPFQTYTLRNMIEMDIIRIGKHTGRKDCKKHMWYVPVNHAVHRDYKDLPFDPYALGALIGDGCLTEPCLAISTSDEAVVSRVANAVSAKGYKRRHEANYTWDFIQDKLPDGRDKRVKRPDLSSSLYQDTVFGLKSVDRRIPREYMLGSIEQRLDLLHGLMDTDGTVAVSDGRINICFSTNSVGLSQDVRELAATLGYRTSINTEIRNDDVHKGIEYCVYFIVDERTGESLFTLRRHIDKIRYNVRQDKKFHKIYEDVAVDYVRDLGYDCEMTCIYVAATSHLYQTGYEHIVTHNTALVQGLAKADPDKLYLEVDLAKMIADLNDPNEMAARLKSLFDEVARQHQETGKIIVLFIDEFHQVVQLSAAAVEALKPLLADSGTRGIRVIAATTLKEFNQYIMPNQPLVERLQRITLSEPGKDATISILKSFAKKYGVADKIHGDGVYNAIYEQTNRYIPANAQPRKSILLLDAMIGYHNITNRPLDKKLLADVIYQSEGINVNFRVDAVKIKEDLDAAVFSQRFATSTVSDALQIAVAELNDTSRPMCSLLFTGPSGCGKGLWDEELVPVWCKDGSVHHKKNGDLIVGDYVFNRKGKPVQVTGVYHRGLKKVYRVTLTDNRSVVVDGSHLWTWMYARGHKGEGFVTTNTEDMIRRGVTINNRNGSVSPRFYIPMNGAVEYETADLSVHPYVIGALLGNGCLTIDATLTLSSGNRFVPEKVCQLIGAIETKQYQKNYSWCFVYQKGVTKRGDAVFSRNAVLKDVPELWNKKSYEKFIPDLYKYGSVEQRWELIQGLFDTDGSIGMRDGDRYNITYSSTSERLLKDIQEVLYSLGISSSITSAKDRNREDNTHIEFRLYVSADNQDKYKFFTYPKKREIAEKARTVVKNRTHLRNLIAIQSIEELPDMLPTTCIMVDDEEHLYQCGPNIVTHNTELTKQLASILFGRSRDDGDANQSSNRNLIRLDMTEYSRPDDVERFRADLTSRVWERPFSVILLDEIEKSCGDVTRLLLQVLDDGRLTDMHGRQVVFTNSYIVMTTNAASEIYKELASYGISEDNEESVKSLMRFMPLIRRSIISTTGQNKFPPELLGRFDAIIPFQPLSDETKERIAKRKLAQISKDISRIHGAQVTYSKDVVKYLVYDKTETDANAGGARQVVAKIREEVVTPLATFLNANPRVRNIGVTVEGVMAHQNKYLLEGTAYIRVAKLGSG